jgi:hypothetical protein
MDQQRFDAFTRSLAEGRSRRGALKVIGGGLAGGLGALFLRNRGALAADCTPDGENCALNSECCSGVCDGVCIAQPLCIGEGDPCSIVANDSVRAFTVILECCNGLTCDAESDTCVAICAEAGEACNPLVQGANGCCEGLDCVDNVCVAPCQPEGEACKGDEDCCAALSCIDSVCTLPCVGESGVCEADEDCCAGLVCDDGSCVSAAPPVCSENGEDCGSDDDCCDALVCIDGSCAAEAVDTGGEDPVTLPSTGIAKLKEDENAGLKIGVMLAGGVGALIAGKRLLP